MRWPLGLGVTAVLAAAVAVGDGGAQATGGRPLAVAVGGGIDHTCALARAGSVMCWGYNGHDELGDGSGYGQNSPIPVSVQSLFSGVTAIGVGLRHSCAVRDGGAVCWGVNYSGALGDGTTDRRVAPVAVVGLSSGVRAVAAGAEHSCALTTAGAVMCWGDNHAGEVGDGTTDDRWTPVPVVGLGAGVRAIAAESVHSCALTDTGGVKCWGAGYGVTPVDVPGLTSGVIGLSASCAITAAHGVKCWSSGAGLKASEVPGLESGVAAVATAGGHGCALTAKGRVLCWGVNDHGQLGDGTRRDRDAPVNVVGLARGVVGIGVGSLSSCAVTLAGGIRCWGSNSAGELGDGTTVDRHRQVAVVGYGLRASLAIRSRSVQVDRNGLARIAVRCGVPVACRGALVLERRSATLGRRSFTLTGGEWKVVPVRLKTRALAALRRAGRLHAIARARFRQPDDGTTTVSRTLTLLAPPR
jgi:alpha-tubulin suppressor-like RCC1 family protein